MVREKVDGFAFMRSADADAQGLLGGEDDQDAELRDGDLVECLGERSGDDTQKRTGGEQSRLHLVILGLGSLHAHQRLSAEGSDDPEPSELCPITLSFPLGSRMTAPTIDTSPYPPLRIACIS